MACVTPSEFRRRWGPDLLVRAVDTERLPAEAAAFLAGAGLPKRFTVDHPELSLHGSFDRLASGIQPLTDEPLVGPPVPSSWSSYLVIGEHRFENGSALYCIHDESGHLVAIDVELDDPVQSVNTSIAGFATSLLMAAEWSEAIRSHSTQEAAAVQDLRQLLIDVDPEALLDRGAFWSQILHEIQVRPAGSVRILRG